MKKWGRWASLVFMVSNGVEASSFLEQDSHSEQPTESHKAKEGEVKKSTASSSFLETESPTSNESEQSDQEGASQEEKEKNFKKGGPLGNGSKMCGSPEAAAAVHGLATGKGGAMADKAKGALGSVAGMAGGALSAAKGALGGLAAAGVAMAAMGKLKQGFCYVGCSAKACANSQRIFTMCTSKCPESATAKCRAARAEKDGF